MSSNESSQSQRASDAALLSEKTFEARRSLLSKVAKRDGDKPKLDSGNFITLSFRKRLTATLTI